MTFVSHRLPVRVYYEDTDMAGVVFYANYLKFMERGRTELLRSVGIDQSQLRQDSGHVFAVRRVESDFLGSAFLDDVLTVETAITKMGGASVTMTQRVMRGEEVLNDAVVVVVCVGPNWKPTRVPPEIKAALTAPAD
jgi:acyl-CoA thioester hydrolase